MTAAIVILAGVIVGSNLATAYFIWQLMDWRIDVDQTIDENLVPRIADVELTVEQLTAEPDEPAEPQPAQLAFNVADTEQLARDIANGHRGSRR